MLLKECCVDLFRIFDYAIRSMLMEVDLSLVGGILVNIMVEIGVQTGDKITVRLQHVWKLNKIRNFYSRHIWKGVKIVPEESLRLGCLCK